MNDPFTRYDRVLCRRTVALAALIAALVALIVAATDERDTTWAGRLSRIAAVLPLAGGLAAYVACDQARGRGELRAHAALGVSATRATGGAWAGGMSIGAIGAAMLLWRRVDLRPLFPRALAFSETWSRFEDGWFESSRGLFVDARGELYQRAAVLVAGPTASADSRVATFAAVLVAALAFPLWAAAAGDAVRRMGVAIAVVAASIGVFHLVAAGRTSSALLVLPPALLLLDAVWLHRKAS